MNSKFTDGQIEVYAAQFREGDAIFVNNNWERVIACRKFEITTENDEIDNSFLINRGIGVVEGFRVGSKVAHPYRVTTLGDYKLQGGEKLVRLKYTCGRLTFGKSYKLSEVKDSYGYYWIIGDSGDKFYIHEDNYLDNWGIIPRYEQVKKFGKEDGEMNNIRMVEEIDYTGKFKVGDKVRPKHYFKLGVVIGVNENDDDYPYLVEFSSGEEDVFNEAALELVNDTKNNNDKLDVLRYSIDKINRPASSHYHTNNNSNDVWNFADDNLSGERVKGFHQVNALKYIARYEKKHDTAEKRIEDLEKAKVSIDKLIELEEEE